MSIIIYNFRKVDCEWSYKMVHNYWAHQKAISLATIHKTLFLLKIIPEN